MNSELKVKWTDALRSGNYTQGREALKRVVDGKPTYCCLGVLCEVAGIKNVRHEFATTRYDFYFDDAVSHLVLSGQYREDIGVTTEKMEVLMEMNDRKYASFDTIADWIDKNL